MVPPHQRPVQSQVKKGTQERVGGKTGKMGQVGATAAAATYGSEKQVGSGRRPACAEANKPGRAMKEGAWGKGDCDATARQLQLQGPGSTRPGSHGPRAGVFMDG